MPKFLENRLKKEAQRKGLRGRRADQYTYGTLNRIGAMRGSKETAKGREMSRKHRQDVATSRRTGRSVAAAGAARRAHRRSIGRR